MWDQQLSAVCHIHLTLSQLSYLPCQNMCVSMCVSRGHQFQIKLKCLSFTANLQNCFSARRQRFIKFLEFSWREYQHYCITHSLSGCFYDGVEHNAPSLPTPIVPFGYVSFSFFFFVGLQPIANLLIMWSLPIPTPI